MRSGRPWAGGGAAFVGLPASVVRAARKRAATSLTRAQPAPKPKLRVLACQGCAELERNIESGAASGVPAQSCPTSARAVGTESGAAESTPSSSAMPVTPAESGSAQSAQSNVAAVRPRRDMPEVKPFAKASRERTLQVALGESSREEARAVLERDMLASPSRDSMEPKLRLYREVHVVWSGPESAWLPETPSSVTAVGVMLKPGRYSSGPNYFSAANVGPANTLIADSWWVMRELELASPDFAEVVVHVSLRQVEIRLSCGKSDCKAGGRGRTHGCSCDAEGPEEAHCPFHAVPRRRQRMLRLFPEAEGLEEFPFYLRADGGRVTKHASQQGVELAATMLALPMCGPLGEALYTGYGCRRTGAEARTAAGIDAPTVQIFGRWGQRAGVFPRGPRPSWIARCVVCDNTPCDNCRYCHRYFCNEHTFRCVYCEKPWCADHWSGHHCKPKRRVSAAGGVAHQVA